MRGVRRAASAIALLLGAAAPAAGAGECDVLGSGFSADAAGCLTVCGCSPTPSPPTPAPDPDPDPDPAPGAGGGGAAADASVCYGTSAHPTIMALQFAGEDIEQHRIAGCSCHASCSQCGYADLPTAETQCIECAEVAAELMRVDEWDTYRTGSCVIPLKVGAARGQITLDAQVEALTFQFSNLLARDMAAAMGGIEASRIEIVSIVAGSVIVTFDVRASTDEAEHDPATAIQTLQTAVAEGTEGNMAGFTVSSLRVVSLPKDTATEKGLMDEEVTLTMEEIIIVGGGVGGLILILFCTWMIRKCCCKKAKVDQRYVADIEIGGNGDVTPKTTSPNPSPGNSPKSPAAIKRAREMAERAKYGEDEEEEEEEEEEENDQLSPLETVSSAPKRHYGEPDAYADDWGNTGDGGSPGGHRREGRARSSSVSSGSGRSRSHSGGGEGQSPHGRSRSASISSGHGKRDDDLYRSSSGRERSRSGSVSSRSRSGSISGTSSGGSGRSRSQSVSGSGGHRSRSGSISSGSRTSSGGSGRDRSHSDSRRRSVSSKSLERTISEDNEEDPRDDMLKAVQAHEAAMAAEYDSPPGSVPQSPGGSRSPKHGSGGSSPSSRGGGERRQSRSSRSHSRRHVEGSDSD